MTISNRVPLWKSRYLRQLVSSLWLTADRSLFQYDVVHVNFPLSALAARLRNRAFVYAPASRAWLGGGSPLERLRHLIDELAVTQSPALIAFNQDARVRFEKIARRLEVPVFVAPLGFDGTIFKPPPDDNRRERTVVDVSSVIRSKRLDITAKACELANVDYVHIGPINDKTYARGLLASYPHTRFLGALPRSQVISILGRSRVFVHSSDMELQSTVTIQAMGCALPVIGSEAVSDLVTNEQTGFIISKAPSNALRAQLTSACIIRLMNDDSLWARMSAAARLYAIRTHDWPAVARRVELLYRQLVSRDEGVSPPARPLER